MSQIMCSRTVKYRAAASPVYIIKADTSSVTIGSDVSYVTYSSNLAFFRRVSGQEDVAYSCYYTVFRKLGSTYTKIKKTTSKATTGYTSSIKVEERGTSTNFSTDAIIICMFDMPSDEHSGYLAELEIPVRKNGDTGSPGEDGKDGKDGKDAASLVFEPAVIVLHADSNGNVFVGQSVYSTVTMMLPNGTTTTQITLLSENLYGDAKGSVSGRTIEVWTDEELLDEDAEGYYVVSYSATINGVTYVAKGSLKITVARDGADGPRGNTGPMSYLAGEYDATVNYGALLTDTGCPVVHFVNGTTDEYWYPTEDYLGAGYPPSVANGWKKANNFEMVVTKILFTQFAKLGGFVVSGDYMLSHYGELIDANGNKLTLTEVTDENGFRSWQYGGVDAYTYFCKADPMVEHEILPWVARNNWSYWSGYLTTTGTTYITLNETSDAKFSELRDLPVDGYYYFYGTDTNGKFYCLLMRKSSYNSTNKRLYGYREKILDYPSMTMFRPAKVVNAVTGEEWMAGGKVHVGADGGVTVEGTVRAKNLYRNLCLFSNGVYSTEVFYISSLNDWSRAKGYAVGDYIIGRPDANAEPDFSSVGMVLCSYDADIIQMVPTSNNSWDSSNPLRLPAPKDFPGKVVEITGWSRTTSEVNMYVGSVMGSVSSMCLAVEISGGKFVPAETATVIAIKTGTTTRFMSMMLNGNYYWTKLNEK